MLRTILTVTAAALVGATSSLASPPAVGDLSAGLGCGAQCIRKAAIAPTMTGGTLAVRADVPAIYTVKISDQAPAFIDGKPWIPFPDLAKNTWLPALGHTFTLDGLAAGTRYHILVTATDTEGRTASRLGTFETLAPPPLPPAVHHEVEREVLLTFWKVEIQKDGDRVGKGELELDFIVEGDVVLGWGRKKVKAPTSTQPHAPEWPIVIEAAPEELGIRVLGRECDNATKSNCAWEAGDTGCGEESRWDVTCAEGAVDLTAPAGGALPPNFGTNMPAGHDRYFVLNSQPDEKLQFVVYGYLDVVEE